MVTIRSDKTVFMRVQAKAAVRNRLFLKNSIKVAKLITHSDSVNTTDSR
jgi:hypothetical protein